MARAVGLAQNLIQTVKDAYEEAIKLRQQQLQQMQAVQVTPSASMRPHARDPRPRRLLPGP